MPRSRKRGASAMGEKENIPAAGQARGRGERTDTGDGAGSPVARSAEEPTRPPKLQKVTDVTGPPFGGSGDRFEATSLMLSLILPLPCLSTLQHSWKPRADNPLRRYVVSNAHISYRQSPGTCAKGKHGETGCRMSVPYPHGLGDTWSEKKQRAIKQSTQP